MSSGAFYLINFFLAIYFLKTNHSRTRQFKQKTEDLQEKINVLRDGHSREFHNKLALQDKIDRYSSLKSIVEELSQNLDLESVADNLASISFSLIANNRGICLLYLVDKETQLKLRLFKTKKEDRSIYIKAKEGDIFDYWVLRHAVPLLIEDVKRDFRFDLERLNDGEARPISSLVGVPLISESRFLGILRLDYPDIGFYSQDDLRLLVAVCDLGAVALENGELFKKTQELAVRDELTSLYTKGYFLQRLKEECMRSLRQMRPLSLLMLDIDFFKNYNDKFGHTAGDIVLQAMAPVINEVFKDTDAIVSRFGGEEFCIAISGMDKKKAQALACELLARIEKTKIVLRKQETGITVSIGVSALFEDTKEGDELIIKADRAMYEAKQQGRNCVCMSS